MVATNKAITAAIVILIVKKIDIKNEHLWCHAITLIDNLEPLHSFYLKKHNLTSIAPVIGCP